MYKQAQRYGVPIPEAEMTMQKQNMKPDTEISKNFDPIANKYRTIPWTDVVHESVGSRAGANNPNQT